MMTLIATFTNQIHCGPSMMPQRKTPRVFTASEGTFCVFPRDIIDGVSMYNWSTGIVFYHIQTVDI